MSPEGKFPTAGDQFEIEHRAITLLRQLLPQWAIREQSPDFGIDYLVEPLDAGEYTGKQLGIQLKGRRSKKSGQVVPPYQLSTKHLAYYLDRCEFPVFLVVIDVDTQEGHWAFMQKFGSEADPSWRTQQTISVRFNSENSLSDHKRFVSAVFDALEYTRNLHPGSVAAALRNRRQALEAKDERVNISIDFVDGCEHVTFHPKKGLAVELQLIPTTATTAKSLLDFVEKGTDLRINLAEVQISGTPLLESKGNGELQIQNCQKAPGHVLLTWGSPDPREQLHIPAAFSSGVKYVSFKAQLPHCPLKLEGTIDPSRWDTGTPLDLEFSFNPSEWEGRRVTALSHFDQTLRFSTAIMQRAEVSVYFHIRGDFLGRARLSDLGVGKLAAAHEFLEMLQKARILGHHFARSLVVPRINEINSTLRDSVEELHNLIVEKRHRRKVPNISLRYTLDRSPPPGSFAAEGTVAIMSGERSYKVFGAILTVHGVEQHFSHMKLIRSEALDDNGRTKLEFVGTQDSENVIQFSTGSTPQMPFSSGGK